MTDKIEVGNIQVTRKYIAQKCPVCNGWGTVSNQRVKCHACEGIGYIRIPVITDRNIDYGEVQS